MLTDEELETGLIQYQNTDEHRLSLWKSNPNDCLMTINLPDSVLVPTASRYQYYVRLFDRIQKKITYYVCYDNLTDAKLEYRDYLGVALVTEVMRETS